VKPRPANIGQKLCRPTGLVLFDLRYFASGILVEVSIELNQW
jgi:hypothetical protein